MDVVASEVDQTTATVTVTVDVPTAKAVQLHYKQTSDTGWGGPMSATVALDGDTSTYTAEFALSGLTIGNCLYGVRVV